MNSICVVCSAAMKLVFVKNDIGIQECKKCRYRAADMEVASDHTNQFYADDYFSDGADGYSDCLKDNKILQSRARWYGRLLAKHGITKGRLLDVGAAAGFMAKGFEQEGWESHGLEPNQSMVEYGRDILNLNMHQGTLESVELPDQFDVVSIIQVMAHFTDPGKALCKAAAMTKPEGHWLIESWNYQSLTARIFGKSWHQYSPPRTLHWFTPTSLTAVAKKFGMSCIASGRPDKSITAQHAKSLLRHATDGSALSRLATSPAGLLPDRLKIPYPADDVAWYLFRREA